MHADERVTVSDRLKAGCAGMSVLCTLAFMIMAIIRLDSDVRGSTNAGEGIEWGQTLAPLAAACAFLLLWAVINYVSSKPITSGSLPKSQGTQFLYNMVTQLLVNRVEVRAIETLNEATLLRDILRLAAYSVIVAYCFLATTYQCKGCEVPYQLLGIGWGSVYALRAVMLMYNGFYSYRRYEDMAREVRVFQESLDQTRLFDQAIAMLYESGQRRFAAVLDGFLFALVVAFGTMGSLWVHGRTCESSCSVVFHLYNCLLLALYVVEGCNVVSKFMLMYYERMHHLEGFEVLVTRIEEKK